MSRDDLENEPALVVRPMGVYQVARKDANVMVPDLTAPWKVYVRCKQGYLVHPLIRVGIIW